MFLKRPIYRYDTMSLEQAIEHFQPRVIGISKSDAHLTQDELNSILNSFRGALANTNRQTLWLADDIRTYLLLHGCHEHDITPTRAEFDHSYRMVKRPETSQSLLWRTRLSIWWEKLTRLFHR